MQINDKANNLNETKLWHHQSNLAISLYHSMQASFQLIQLV